MNNQSHPVPQRVRPTEPPAPSTSPLADHRQKAPEPEPQAAAPEAPVPPRNRKPFGQLEYKLAWPKITGYFLYWFNDVPGRIDRAKEAGYEHVTDDKGRPVQLVMGSAERGGGLTGYLMKIPQAWYDQDFAEQQKAVDATDEAIWRGRIDQRPDDNRYVPKDSIKIGVTRGRG